MEQITDIINVFIHLDDYISNLHASLGAWTYVIVFGIIFAETGLIIMPFLPGDSLLFVLGALSASHILDIWILWISLIAAAIMGDSVNYYVGSRMAKAIRKSNQKIVKPEHLELTKNFYAKYGAKAIVLARFLPIVRTVIPFLAGAGHMEYRTFFFYNCFGAVLWVTICLWAGFFFGQLPWVEENFSLVILAIIIISLLPAVYEFIQHKRSSR